MMREGLLVMLLLTLSLAAVGCPPQQTRGPEPDPIGALEAWHQALVDGRAVDAYALLHPDATEGLDEGAFVALYARQKEALIAQARRLLDHARSQPPTERARVTVGETAVELVRGPSGWRLTAPVGAAAGDAQ